MKLSFKLALSYLIKQKGRSIALITSIALAVILVFTLNVIPETKSEIDIEDAYKNFSDYHVEYTNLNKDTVDKLKKDKDVKEIESTLNFGDIVSKNRVRISLNSYNKSFIDDYGYTPAKGQNPVNENEIVLEEKALKEMGLSNELNQMIEFTIVKKYVDENNQNQIYSENLKLKLVGYNGVLKFNGRGSDVTMTYKKIGEYKLNDRNFMVNTSLREVLDYSLIMITHNNEIANMADKCIKIQDGVVIS